MTEQQLQAACTQWFWNEYPEWRRMLVMIDNNSESRRTGNVKKAMGVVKGASDTVLFLWKSAVCIEFKTEAGRQRPEQIDFQLKMEDRGHMYFLIRTLQEFKELIWNLIGKS